MIKDAERTAIPDCVIKAIADKLTEAMKQRIDNISPDDDPSGLCFVSSAPRHSASNAHHSPI